MNNAVSTGGLGLLALLTAGLCVAAVIHVRPTDAPVKATPKPVASSTSPVAAASATPTATPRVLGKDAAKQLFSQQENLSVVVIGDGSGAGEKSWVDAWAREMSAQRTVELAKPSKTPTPLGTSSRRLSITNRSSNDLSLTTAADQIPQLVDDKTDVVVLSFGHYETDPDVSARMKALIDKLPQHVVPVVVVQNPERGNLAGSHRNRAKSLSAWASKEGVPSVDVFEAFVDAPEPIAELIADDGKTPTDAGAKRWAKSMSQALQA